MSGDEAVRRCNTCGEIRHGITWVTTLVDSKTGVVDLSERHKCYGCHPSVTPAVFVASGGHPDAPSI